MAKKNGHTQSDYAAIIETDQPTMSKIFSGKMKLSYNQALIMKGLLGGDIDEWKNASPEDLIDAFDLILESRSNGAAA